MSALCHALFGVVHSCPLTEVTGFESVGGIGPYLPTRLRPFSMYIWPGAASRMRRPNRS